MGNPWKNNNPSPLSPFVPGRVEHGLGDHRSFGTINSIVPDFAGSARRLADEGEALLKQQKYGEALPRFLEAARLVPNFDEYQFKVAFAAWNSWEHTLVEPYLLRAVAMAPKRRQPRKMLIEWYAFQGKSQEWVEQTAVAVAHHPGDSDLIVLHAAALGSANQPEAGLKTLKPYLSGNVILDSVARCYGVLAPKLGLETDALAMIDRALTVATLTPRQRSQLHFGASALFDGLGRFDEAFARAKAGNELARHPFDPAANTRKWQKYCAYFSRERLAALPKATHGNNRPVFIIGMPRSGTSLVEQILACHPEVFGAGELSRLSEITCPAATDPWSGGRPYPHCFDAMTIKIADQTAGGYISLIERMNKTARYVTDKMPQNFTYLGHAELLFPDCKIIHCVRDARDTCLSNYLCDFWVGQEFSNDLSHIAEYYRGYAMMMAHWKKVSSLPILDVRYEDLVANQESETRRMLQFLDLPWEEKCLSFHKSKRGVSTASREQVRKPIYSSSIGRWKNYEKHIPELIELKTVGE